MTATLWKIILFCIFIDLLLVNKNAWKANGANVRHQQNGDEETTVQSANDLLLHENTVLSSEDYDNDTETGLKAEHLNRFRFREKSSVIFYLYTRKRNGSETIRYFSPRTVLKSQFVPEVPVKFLIHGYKMTGFSHFSHHLTDAYLKNGDECNIFSVDWKRLAGDRIYFTSAFNARIVGEAVGEFIVYLHENNLISSYEMVHLIGFSLGAHVAGYAGKYIWSTQNQKVGRISGLDPAGPAFTAPDPKHRLDKEDAIFVDVIHTSAGKSGISEAIAHVDFYPNGGSNQPGCLWETLTSTFLRNCSHERAFFLFWESIKGEKFLGCPCSDRNEYERRSCACTTRTAGAALMGEYCPKTARGNKYLSTRAVLVQHIT